MAFWSDATLRAQLPKLIAPYDPSNIICASYELGIGSEVYVTPSNDAKPIDRAKRKLADDDSIVIPRGQFAFLITKEIVSVPNDAVALISIKARIKFRGLVNVSGFHVDPGYSGRLVFSVFNAGASDVVLHCDERAFLIWYASLDAPSPTAKTKPGFMTIPSDLVNGMSDDSLSLSVLDAKIKSVEELVNKISWTGGIIVAILLLLGGVWLRSVFATDNSKSHSHAASVEQISPSTVQEMRRSASNNLPIVVVSPSTNKKYGEVLTVPISGEDATEKKATEGKVDSADQKH